MILKMKMNFFGNFNFFSLYNEIKNPEKYSQNMTFNEFESSKNNNHLLKLVQTGYPGIVLRSCHHPCPEKLFKSTIRFVCNFSTSKNKILLSL